MDNELLSELITCDICMETLTEPHQYPCGHSYCMACLAEMRSRREYRCPECRVEFPANSDVIKNYRLANIVNAYHRPGSIQIPSFPGVGRGNNLTWSHVLLIILASAIFFKVLKVYNAENTERLPSVAEQADICPADLEHQNLKSGVSDVVWILVSFPFRCVWVIVRSIYELLDWLLLSVFTIIYFILAIIFQGILLLCGIACSIWSNVVYTVGCICILYGIALIVCRVNA